jgi:hypothetical protein
MLYFFFYSPPVIHLPKKVKVMAIFREGEKEMTKPDNCVLVVIHSPGANRREVGDEVEETRV